MLLYRFTRGGWIDAVLAGIAIGMSMLPAEFPVVLTLFLAMGTWRIGQAGVLTRRATLFLVATDRGMPEGELRALTFFALVAMILAPAEAIADLATTRPVELC